MSPLTIERTTCEIDSKVEFFRNEIESTTLLDPIGDVDKTTSGNDEGKNRRVSPDVKLCPFTQTFETSRKFRSLLGRWREDVAYVSSIHQLVLHPAYQQIIGMGPDVVPLLLSELRDNPFFLFPALSSITGDNPVSSEHEGDLEAMAQDWIAWGEGQGLFD